MRSGDGGFLSLYKQEEAEKLDPFITVKATVPLGSAFKIKCFNKGPCEIKENNNTVFRTSRFGAIIINVCVVRVHDT